MVLLLLTLFIVTPIVGVCNCSMFCCMLLFVRCSIAIILMGKRELVALLDLSSWCLMMVGRLFLAVPWGRLQFVILVFPDHTHLLFSTTSVLFFCFLIFLQIKQQLLTKTVNQSKMDMHEPSHLFFSQTSTNICNTIFSAQMPFSLL